MKILKIFIFILAIISSSKINAFEIKDVQISGNKRVSIDTIIETIKFKKNNKYSPNDLNEFQKKLFETNFFKDVKIKVFENILKIDVSENPLINFFYIDGIINKKREDDTYDSLNLGSNKIFSDYLLKEDINIIKKIFQQSGYYNAVVEPKLSLLPDNTINLILNINRGEKLKINKIYFIGNNNYSNSFLQNVISSSEYGWWKFLSSSSTVVQDRVNYDVSLLKLFYLNEGYYDVQIITSDIDLINSGMANITFSINSGPKYNFSNYSINNSENLLNEKLYSQVDIILKNQINGNFSLKKIDNVKEKIYNLINANKLAFVNFKIDFVKIENNKINLIVNFYKTNDIFVNKIDVSGNSLTEEEVIRRNLIFAEGDAFVEYKLNKSIDNLKSTYIFSDIKTNKNFINENLLNINIDVEEQPTGSISAGIGVGSNSSNISTGIQEKNLFGKGINTNTSLTLGTDKISGIASVDLPDFKNTGNTFETDLYILRTDYDNVGYESTVVGSDLGISYDIYEDINIGIKSGLERDKITTSESASALYKSRSGTYMTYKTSYNISSDKRNRKFQPSEGYRLGFGQTLGLPGSDIPYLNNNIYGSYYHTFTKNVIMNVKAGANAINSLNNKDIKLSDRKFLSAKKLRGFESRGIGPKDGKEHVGGNYSTYTSVSSTVPNFTPEKWRLDTIFFIDTGNVWGVDYDDSKDSNKLRSSLGLAIDWISPLGPLSFVFSETISKATGDLDQSFSFELGSSF